MLIIARSILFAGLFHLNLAAHVIAALPTLAMPRRAVMTIAKSWSRTTAWLLRVVCDIKVEWAGLERIPPGRLIVASKHQSTWEIFALIGAFDDPAFIIKGEAMQIPLLGWCMRKAGMVAIGRGRAADRAALTERARRELDRGRQLIVFPEGARRLPGAEPVYGDVVARLYSETGAPCLPVALSSGLLWRLRSLARRPGTIRVEFLDVIPPGLPL
ncbi:MAG TPA: lysophospholipid acyltransferase family protein, partial [Xanthobacteraceae bacterium]|nr:lysophospholipid acyltransferase family protein [Xanthobacteraceae bacterium]